MFAKNRRTEVNYDLINKINSNNNYKIYDYTNMLIKSFWKEQEALF